MASLFQIQHNTLSITIFLILLLLVITSSVEGFKPGFAYTRTSSKCTPKYWSSRKEAWPRMIPQTATVSNVFGSRTIERFRSDLTVLEATARSDGGEAYRGLLKQGIAALINSYARKGYPYSPWGVKSIVIGAMVSEEAASAQAQRFKLANLACV